MARVFVAIPLSGGLQEQASLVEDKLAHLPVRWIVGKNLHITLVAPWQQGDTFAAINLLEQLEGRVKPFTINFERVDLGPNPRQPRLIWAAGQAPQELIALKSAAEKIFGKPAESRPYQLHCTLARLRAENFDENIFKTVPREINWQQEVKEVVLMESRLSSAGADYKILAKVTLE